VRALPGGWFASRPLTRHSCALPVNPKGLDVSGEAFIPEDDWDLHRAHVALQRR
jgi:hypothetical protein